MRRVTLVPYEHPVAATGVGGERLSLQHFADEIVRAYLPGWKPLRTSWKRLFVHAATPEATPAAAARADAAFTAAKHACEPVTIPGVETARKKLKRLDPEDRLAAAAAAWNEWVRGPYEGVEFVAEGFAHPSPLEAELLAAVGAARVPAADVVQPPGLAHLVRELFSDSPLRSGSAAGLYRIEGPGTVGELTLVARRIRQHIADGIPPDQIVVTARRPGLVMPELREVFAEYAVPLTLPVPDPLSADPAVAFLLRAWRVPDTDFAFPAVAAVLRNSLLRPPGVPAELALSAELFLRLTNEPGGRDVYLAALKTWGTVPPKPLEDEHPHERRRKQLLSLAHDCGQFLPWFFARWDDLRVNQTPGGWAQTVRRFAQNLGLDVPLFLAEIDAWAEVWPQLMQAKTLSPVVFTNTLETLARLTPGTQPLRGGVRVLPPEAAETADCEVLCVLNLGEGSFPDLGGDCGDVRMAAEQDLFRGLASRPRVELCLSYPAVDTKGQTLLPSSFLTAVEKCFAENSIPVERRRMRIEGYAEGVLCSAAESRIAFVRDMTSGVPVPSDVRDNLIAARRAAVARYWTKDFGPFDGKLANPATLADVRSRVGETVTFSPTGLELYAACPFRYWFDRVLRLTPLDEPSEGIEATRRGEVVHRALKRLYEECKGRPLPELLEAAAGELAAGVASPAGKVLWQLEGKFLARKARRFHRQEEKYFDTYPKAAPAHLEKEISPVVINAGGEILRVGGRIDRIDLVPLDGEVGFTVVDYKTGAASGYTTKAVDSLQRIQLGVYALAAEQELVKGRPVGMTYWATAKDGPVGSFPAKKRVESWLASAKEWEAYRERLLNWLGVILRQARAGNFALSPRDEDCTAGCRFGPACRVGGGRGRHKPAALPLPTVDAADSIREE